MPINIQKIKQKLGSSEIGWGNDQLLDLISFRESKSHHDGAPEIPAPSLGGRASWDSQCHVAEVSPASSLSTRMSEQTGTLSLIAVMGFGALQPSWSTAEAQHRDSCRIPEIPILSPPVQNLQETLSLLAKDGGGLCVRAPAQP